MNQYEQRKEDRIERLEARAAKRSAESNSAFDAAHNATAGIPFGQPILVGHHSEKRHRAAIARADSAMSRGCELASKAQHAQERASAAASNRAIDSDDPNAPEKLRAKIERLTKTQEVMKAANQIVRRKPKNEATDAKLAELEALGLKEYQARKLFEVDFAGRIGFPSYELTNNNANIRRLKERLVEVEALPDEGDEPQEFKFGPVTVEHNPDEGRVLVYTPERNEEATKLMRGHGFNWKKSMGCWSRKLTRNAIAVCEHTIGPRLAEIYGGAA